MRPAAVRDALQNQSKGGLRNGESFEIIRISFLDTATFGIHERQRSDSFSGPPGSRSRHLGIKRGMHTVGLVRWGRNHPRIKENLSGGVGFVRWCRNGLWDEMWDF
jgi:hypothetical protein